MKFSVVSRRASSVLSSVVLATVKRRGGIIVGPTGLKATAPVAGSHCITLTHVRHGAATGTITRFAGCWSTNE